MAYDLVIKGGVVVDPAQGIHGKKDVALAGGKIAAVADTIPTAGAGRVVDVGGRIVTAGLIDLHTHLFPGVSNLGIDVDEWCLARGVTTSVDAGTTGSITFPGFRNYAIRAAKSRVYVYVHLASIGLVAHHVGELRDMLYADAEGLAKTIEANRDICLGIKIRMGMPMITDFGFKPMEMCLQVAEQIKCSIMVHITEPAVPLGDLFDMLRPGDIITHLLHGRHGTGGTVVQNGKVIPALWRAQQRGVGTDVGHGAGSFAFATAKAALADGFKPFTISTDLHTMSIEGPCFDLVTTMAKFIALGMTLDEVVAATTINAARTIGKDHAIGSLQPGIAGDVTVLDVTEGDFTFGDCEGETIKGNRMLKAAMTVLGGEIVASKLGTAAVVSR